MPKSLQIWVTGGKLRVSIDGAPSLPAPFSISDLNDALVGVFNRRVADKPRSQEDLNAFGMILYEILQGANSSFRESLLYALKESDGSPVRVQIGFDRLDKESMRFAGYPWEFLYQPPSADRRRFRLSTYKDVAFSRTLLQPVPTPKPIEERIKVLVAVSQPAGAAAPGVDALLKLLEHLKANYNLDYKHEPNATCALLEDQLDKFEPHIFHFAGHARSIADQGVEVDLLHDDLTRRTPVPELSFAELVTKKRTIHLTFLQACESGAVNYDSGFYGLAPLLLEMGVPAVVAMQYPIDIATAEQFAVECYSRLLLGMSHSDFLLMQRAGRGASQREARGEAIDVALQSARALVNWDVEFATPVLYVSQVGMTPLPPLMPIASGAEDKERAKEEAQATTPRAELTEAGPPTPSAQRAPAPPSPDAAQNKLVPEVPRLKRDQLEHLLESKDDFFRTVTELRSSQQARKSGKTPQRAD